MSRLLPIALSALLGVVALAHAADSAPDAGTSDTSSAREPLPRVDNVTKLRATGGIEVAIPSFAGGNGKGSAQLNPINCYNDAFDAGASPGNSCVQVVHTFGGPQMKGGRIALGVFGILNAPSSPSNALPQYVGVSATAQASVKEGGTATAPRGNLYGIEPVCALMVGAMYWDECTGAEFNVAVQSGASAAYKALATFVGRNDDAVQGSVFDAVLAISNQTGAVAHRTGILLGNMNGIWPFDAASCLICTGVRAGTKPTYTLGSGVDLTTIAISGNAYASHGFSVDGGGNLHAAGLFPGAGTFKVGVGQIYTHPALGLVAVPNGGAVNDFTLASTGGTTVAAIPAGTTLLKASSRFAVPFGTPASASAPCVPGEVMVDATYLYTCVAANSWHRASNGTAW